MARAKFVYDFENEPVTARRRSLPGQVLLNLCASVPKRHSDLGPAAWKNYTIYYSVEHDRVAPICLACRNRRQRAQLRAKPESLVDRLRHDILRGGRRARLAAASGRDRRALRGEQDPGARGAAAARRRRARGAAAQSRVHGGSGCSRRKRRKFWKSAPCWNARRCAIAMPKMTDADVARAAASSIRRKQTDALDRWSDLNWEFHATLYGTGQAQTAARSDPSGLQPDRSLYPCADLQRQLSRPRRARASRHPLGLRDAQCRRRRSPARPAYSPDRRAARGVSNEQQAG